MTVTRSSIATLLYPALPLLINLNVDTGTLEGAVLHTCTDIPKIKLSFVFKFVSQASDCPSGWDGYGNSCYKFVIQPSSMQGLNWENARRDCLGYGGDLVSIANQSEMSFVYYILNLQNSGVSITGLASK